MIAISGVDGSVRLGSHATTEVVVRQDPTVKAVGSSVKLGLIVYIW